MKKYIIPIFIPELACPNRCVYCNQKYISGQLDMPTEKEIIDKIESYLVTFRSPFTAEIAFFGGNFTGIDIEQQIKYLEVVQRFILEGYITNVRISTRPDYINQERLNILKIYNVKVIELGAQSLCQNVLDESNRGHSVKDVEYASKLINENGFELGLQMMIGLPGDTIEKSIETANKIIALGAKNTRIYPTLVIENTDLAELYKKGLYKSLTISEAVEWTSKIYELFIEKNINILRVGLHPSEALINKKELLSGPFHVSFRELVLSKIWRDKLMKLKNAEGKEIKINVNKKDINYIIGYNSSNKDIIIQKGIKLISELDNKYREFYFEYCE